MKTIKSFFIKKLHQKIIKDLNWKVDYGDIIRIDGEEIQNNITLSNHLCHFNSYDVYKKKKKMDIKLCWASDKDTDYGFIHFINYNTKTNKYFDNTLGSKSNYYTYYILNDSWISKFKSMENPYPSKWLTWAKEDFYNKYCINWLWQKFIKISDM